MQLTINKISIVPNPTPFDSSNAHWLTEPEVAFDAWVSQLELKPESAGIYRWMWRKFIRWMHFHGIRLDTLESHQLDRFLNASELHKRHRLRYVRLIERVFTYLHTLADSSSLSFNPASEAAKLGYAKGINSPTRFLLASEREALLSLLADANSRNVDPVRTRTPSQKWKWTRDLALLAVFLGAGVKVHEAINLTVSCISIEDRTITIGNVDSENWWMNEQDDVALRPRIIPIEAFAWDAIQSWLTQKKSNVAQVTLFPSTPKGDAMHPSTIFRKIRALFLQAGLEANGGERSCCQTLRNSYAAALIDRKESHALLAERMGWSDSIIALKMSYSYAAFLKSQEDEVSQGTII